MQTLHRPAIAFGTVAAVGLMLAVGDSSAAEKPARDPAACARERDEAVRCLKQFEAARPKYSAMVRWHGSQAAALAGLAAGSSGSPAAPLRLAGQLQWLSAGRALFAEQQDDGPPALLWSALRAARRAVQADPDDADAHLLLGDIYLRLSRDTRERAWRRQLPLLDQLRKVQAVTALKRAVVRKPDLAAAHVRLMQLYREMGFLDLSREHLKAYVKASQAAGPAKGEERERFTRRMEEANKHLAALDKVVTGQFDRYEVGSAGRKVPDRVQMALRLGLAGKALEVLLASDASVFGSQGARVELELLLSTGRVKEVGEWMTPEVRRGLGDSFCAWLDVLRTAALGDYAAADKQLKGLSDSRDLRSVMATMLVNSILTGSQKCCSPLHLALWEMNRRQSLARAGYLAAALRHEADLMALRGLLAREAGQTKEATAHFRQALALWGSEAAAASGAGLDFAARPMAQQSLQSLRSGER